MPTTDPFDTRENDRKTLSMGSKPRFTAPSPTSVGLNELSKVGDVYRELSDLSIATHDLLDLIEKLLSYLSPAMNYDREEPEDPQSPRPCVVPVAQNIRENKDRVRAAMSMVNRMINCCEI